jgi:hypothetical protein
MCYFSNGTGIHLSTHMLQSLQQHCFGEATLPEPLILLRNMVVGALNPFMRRSLARRLSLLNYLEEKRSEHAGMFDESEKSKPTEAA